MSEGDALLKAVIENPGDDAPRLVYADWLDEHGDPDRAAFIRVQCETGQWERVHDPEPTPGKPRQDQLVHRDGRVRDPQDSEWQRLLQLERELAERNWLTWLRPLTDIFRSPRNPQTATRTWRFVRRLIGRPDPELEFAYDPNHAPVQSCAFRLPRLVLDKNNPLRRVALTRGFAGLFQLGSHVTADQVQNLLAGFPVEYLTFERPSAGAVAKRGSRRVSLRNLLLMHADLPAATTILLGDSNFDPRQLTIIDRTCSADLATLLAVSPVVAKLEGIGLVFSGFNDCLSPAEAVSLASNPHFCRLRKGSLAIVAGLQGNETIRILTERFGSPRARAGFGYEFRLAPVGSSEIADGAAG